MQGRLHRVARCPALKPRSTTTGSLANRARLAGASPGPCARRRRPQSAKADFPKFQRRVQPAVVQIPRRLPRTFEMQRLIDLSHTVEHGMVTLKGYPAPI